MILVLPVIYCDDCQKRHIVLDTCTGINEVDYESLRKQAIKARWLIGPPSDDGTGNEFCPECRKDHE